MRAGQPRWPYCRPARLVQSGTNPHTDSMTFGRNASRESQNNLQRQRDSTGPHATHEILTHRVERLYRSHRWTDANGNHEERKDHDKPQNNRAKQHLPRPDRQAKPETSPAATPFGIASQQPQGRETVFPGKLLQSTIAASAGWAVSSNTTTARSVRIVHTTTDFRAGRTAGSAISVCSVVSCITVLPQSLLRFSREFRFPPFSPS
jgi:hypothetical protein